MNINKIKEEVYKLKDKKLKIKVVMRRNKYEYLEGTIKDFHSNIFTIDTNKGLRSFTYADVATKSVIFSKIWQNQLKKHFNYIIIILSNY